MIKKLHEKNNMYLFLKKFNKTKILIQKFIIKNSNKSNKNAKKMLNVEINSNKFKKILFINKNINNI